MDPQSVLNITGDYIVITNNQKYEDVSAITHFYETITGAGSLKKEFRWSKDNVSFSNLIELTLTNLQDYIVTSEPFYVEYRYELLNDVTTTINSIELVVTYTTSKWDNFLPFPIAFKEKGNRYSPIVTRPFSLNIHTRDFQQKAVNLYRDLNFVINQLHGQEVHYSRTVPVLESRDPFLGNYSAFKSSDPMKVKVMIMENQFPDNKFNVDIFGTHFEMFPEVHIDKRYFEWIFGNATGPQRGDILYFPINDRFYEVESSQLLRTFMNVPSYYKLQLDKWDRKISVVQSEQFSEILDRYTTSAGEVFKDAIEEISNDVSPDFYKKTMTKEQDPIRNFIIDPTIIKQENLENYDLLLSKHYYDLSQVFFVDNLNSTAITYNVENKVTTDWDFTYTCWFKEVTGLTPVPKKVSTVTLVSPYTYKLKLSSDVPAKYKEGTTLKLTISNNSNFYLNCVLESFDSVKRELIVKTDPTSLTIANGTLANWTTNANLYVSGSDRRNLIESYDYDNNKGVILDIVDNKYAKITLNSDINYFNISSAISGNNFSKWYGLIFTMSNKFKQISLNLYKIDDSDKSSDLIPTFEYVMNGANNFDISNNIPFKLLNSPIHLRNIRILTDVIQEEQHSNFLNQNIIENSSKAVIVDNCLPRLQLTFMGNPK